MGYAAKNIVSSITKFTKADFALEVRKFYAGPNNWINLAAMLVWAKEHIDVVLDQFNCNSWTEFCDDIGLGKQRRYTLIEAYEFSCQFFGGAHRLYQKSGTLIVCPRWSPRTALHTMRTLDELRGLKKYAAASNLEKLAKATSTTKKKLFNYGTVDSFRIANGLNKPTKKTAFKQQVNILTAQLSAVNEEKEELLEINNEYDARCVEMQDVLKKVYRVSPEVKALIPKEMLLRSFFRG